MCSLSLNLIFVTYIAILFFFFSVLGLLLQQHILISKSVRMLWSRWIYSHPYHSKNDYNNNYRYMIELITHWRSLSCVRLMMYSVCAQLKGTAQWAWYHLKCSGQGVGVGINRKTCTQTDTDLQTKVFKDILSVYRDNENKSDVNQLFPPDK